MKEFLKLLEKQNNNQEINISELYYTFIYYAKKSEIRTLKYMLLSNSYFQNKRFFAGVYYYLLSLIF